MADELEEIASAINASINIYRAKIATPESFEDLRKMVQDELKKIESGFVSVDEVLKAVAAGASGSGETAIIEGAKGDPGPPGRGIMTYKQSGTPVDAFPGDVWFVQGYN